MARATKAAGDSYTPEEKQDPNPPIRIRRALLGEVDKPSVGGGSSLYSKSVSKPRKTASATRRKPAQMMGNPLSAPEMETASDADMTGGSGPQTGTESNRQPVDDDDF